MAGITICFTSYLSERASDSSVNGVSPYDTQNSTVNSLDIEAQLKEESSKSYFEFFLK
jgi:hypothetical protein